MLSRRFKLRRGVSVVSTFHLHQTDYPFRLFIPRVKNESITTLLIIFVLDIQAATYSFALLRLLI